MSLNSTSSETINIKCSNIVCNYITVDINSNSFDTIMIAVKSQGHFII